MKKELYWVPNGESVFIDVSRKKLFQYSKDDEKIHELYGGKLFYTSQTGLNGLGNIYPTMLQSTNLIFCNSYMNGKTPWVIGDNKLYLGETNAGEQIYISIFVPFNRENIDNDWDKNSENYIYLLYEVGNKQLLLRFDDFEYLLPFIKRIIERVKKGDYYVYDAFGGDLESISLRYVSCYNSEYTAEFFIEPEVKHSKHRNYFLHFFNLRGIALQYNNEYKRISFISDYTQIGKYIHKYFVKTKCLGGKNDGYFKGFYIQGQFIATKLVRTHPLLDLYEANDLDYKTDYALFINKAFSIDKNTDNIAITIIRNIFNYTKGNKQLENHILQNNIDIFEEYQLDIVNRAEFMFNQEEIITKGKKALDKKIRIYLLNCIRNIKKNKKDMDIINSISHETIIVRKDSIDAGNCRYGTDNFINKYFKNKTETTVGELKKHVANKYVKRVLLNKVRELNKR